MYVWVGTLYVVVNLMGLGIMYILHNTQYSQSRMADPFLPSFLQADIIGRQK